MQHWAEKTSNPLECERKPSRSRKKVFVISLGSSRCQCKRGSLPLKMLLATVWRPQRALALLATEGERNREHHAPSSPLFLSFTVLFGRGKEV
jgi:hypothetical protein